MTKDDPRHGTRAGYIAHLRAGQAACARCLTGRNRQEKQVRFDNYRGVRMLYTADEVAAVLYPWLALGLSYGAIANAADLGTTHGSRLAERVAEGRPFRRGTYQALAAVTEDDIPASSKVFAALTRARIYSLRAAGHTLRSIPILDTGQWRNREHITVRQARDVRDHYAANEATMGTCRNSQGRALRQGHRPPLAWDDPGTLAWPLGWTEPLPTADIDLAVVERVLAGEWRLRAARPEREEVVRRWRACGRPVNELGRLTGWKPERYYEPGTEVA